ncbi:Arm DNA-binding domain-containing protein [Burkholderia ambifaria]|uniref:Arm DNA-binding domain-containing protein n=1 Tax=Burkholderia ambifaria TaxID=152480 RepID=UPI0022A98CEA|nr:Arm DNA-binding domain-containing protein [Burkholderia ambifaria]WAS54581.1 Arm DNA-binding domain-containing protein [Burkholderia ambifaria]
MKSRPLTDAKCRKAKLDEAGGNKLFDGSGLFLNLRASGSKKWRLKYRFSGKENLLTFGDYPATSFADARSRRDEAKRLLADLPGKSAAATSSRRRLDAVTATKTRHRGARKFPSKSLQRMPSHH